MSFRTDADAATWLERWYPVIFAQQVRGTFVYWRAGRSGPQVQTPIRRFAERLRRQRLRRGKPV
jgi:hypothetical protein